MGTVNGPYRLNLTYRIGLRVLEQSHCRSPILAEKLQIQSVFAYHKDIAVQRGLPSKDRSCAAAARQFSPSAARNRGPIRDVLARVLPKNGIVLEIGSGTGEHAVCFARALPGLLWLPSDPDRDARASIKAWIGTEHLANVREPVAIDVCRKTWDVERKAWDVERKAWAAERKTWDAEDDAPFDAMVCLNMIHIAPWAASVGLLSGAGRLLRSGGILFLYGPFMRGGAHTAASNASFDADLKRRDKDWGIRDLDELVHEAAPHGFELREAVNMPANNLSLVFVKANPAHHSTAADTAQGPLN